MKLRIILITIISLVFFSIALFPTITYSANPTRTPRPTRTPNATKTAIAAAKAELAQYKAVNPADFASYPTNYIGQKIKLRGRVWHIEDDFSFYIWTLPGYHSVFVTTAHLYQAVKLNQRVTVYGTGDVGKWLGVWPRLIEARVGR
jgi:hypothetical protein